MDHHLPYQGQQLFYRSFGSGKPVVFVHGFAEDGNIFEEQVNHLKASYRLIIPDLPGSGLSPFQENANSIEALATAVLAVVDAEKIDKSIIIGHSMGGYITLALAELHPERLESFGLFHSSSYADDEEKKKARMKSVAFIEENGSAKFIEEASPKLFSERYRKQFPGKVREITDRYANFKPDALVQYIKAMMQRPDRSELLKEWPSAVLMIIGEEDSAIPLQLSLPQTHLPKQCYIHIAKETGHMGMLEDPAGCNQIIRSFLDGL